MNKNYKDKIYKTGLLCSPTIAVDAEGGPHFPYPHECGESKNLWKPSYLKVDVRSQIHMEFLSTISNIILLYC